MEKFEIDSNDEAEKFDYKQTKRKKSKSKKNKKYKFVKPLILTIIFMISFIIILLYFYKTFQESRKNFIPNKYYNVLIGDIGGVHSRLRLLNMTSNISITPILIHELNDTTASYKTLEELLIKFLSDINPKNKPDYAFLGVPGPIEDNCIITLPNIPQWESYNGTELGKKLGFKKLIFINDFVGDGYAIQTNLVEKKDYIVLNKAQPKKNGAKLMIGPGTGLGMGFLLKNEDDNGYYTIGSSEGGGRDYAPKTKFDFKLRNFIKNETGLSNISLETICSARALILIYKFLHITENDNDDYKPKLKREPNLAKKIDNFHNYKEMNKIHEINSELIKKGLKDECQLSKRVLLIFLEIYGEITGDLALFTLANNGVYLLGRLTRELTPLILENTIFMNHFKNKDHFWFLLERIPVYLIQNENIELIGITEAARRFFEENEN